MRQPAWLPSHRKCAGRQICNPCRLAQGNCASLLGGLDCALSVRGGEPMWSVVMPQMPPRDLGTAGEKTGAIDGPVNPNLYITLTWNSSGVWRGWAEGIVTSFIPTVPWAQSEPPSALLRIQMDQPVGRLACPMLFCKSSG